MPLAPCGMLAFMNFACLPGRPGRPCKRGTGQEDEGGRGILAAIDGGGIELLAGTQLIAAVVCQEAARHVEDGLQAREGILQSCAPRPEQHPWNMACGCILFTCDRVSQSIPAE